MNQKEIAQNVLKGNGGIAKTADFVAAGINKYDVAALCKEGFLERVRRGVYQSPGNDQITDEQLLRELLPQGIVCAESALFHYGYSDFAPREWTIAVPRSYSRTVKAMQEKVPVKAYYVQNEMYRLGETTGLFNGVNLLVYDRERTVCDCFKYRTKLDNEIFNKAINAYVADQKKNLANLSKYAKEMGVYKKMMSEMEVLLNG